MAISRVVGQMLQANLERDGNALAVINTANSTPLLYLDVTQSLVGINTATPNVALQVIGNISANNLSTTGNIAGNYIFGNGSQLTGLPVGYSNAEVAAFLAEFGSNVISTTGNITSGNLSVSGNIVGGNLLINGLISATSTITSSANIVGGNILTVGLISAT